AATNGYTLESAQYRWFWRGPFFLRSTEEQSVFYVTVKDAGGRARKGWVRCGSFWAGILSDKATVKWDE
ncbi:MAG: hypothetical protein OER88_01820, partial [Planctomycetota bacterium]|nr:hypothetical protein [Planctomycetota bacterium]